MTPDTAPISLAEAPPCRALRITAFAGDGEDAARLQVMGLCVGRQVELLHPGDPMIVRVLGSRIGISSRLASQITAVVEAAE